MSRNQVLQLRRLAGEQKFSAQKFKLHDFGRKKRNKKPVGGNMRSRAAVPWGSDRGSRSRRTEKRRGVVKDIPVEQPTKFDF
jgi:hypothetical protein